MSNETDNAFEQLLITRRPMALRFARRLIHDFQIAEDVVQEASVKAWMSFGDWRGDFGAWLRRITERASLDAIRQKDRKRQILLSLETDLRYAAEEADERGELCGDPMAAAEFRFLTGGGEGPDLEAFDALRPGYLEEPPERQEPATVAVGRIMHRLRKHIPDNKRDWRDRNLAKAVRIMREDYGLPASSRKGEADACAFVHAIADGMLQPAGYRVSLPIVRKAWERRRYFSHRFYEISSST